jgi:ABC-type amino acid transport substrate-binding protein/ABC-type amino acid transport system permease subunit
MTLLRILSIVLAALTALSTVGAAQDANTPDAALAKLVADAKAQCGKPDVDRLVSILCDKRIRVGARDYYPLFSMRDGDKRSGYEVDVADAIAEKFGVEAEFTRVNAASRIPVLADDRVDFVIATMGHNTQRDTQVRFIRPHYYQSETTVVGPRAALVASWLDMPGRTVCATIGNGSNAELVAHDVRLMLFDEAGVLPDRLKDGTCQLAAQDDSFFAFYFTDPSFAERFAQKFGFAQVPWGMAVKRTGSDKLALALDLISQIFHRDGVFLKLAQKNRIGTTFLREQNAVWKRIDCDTATGYANPACILPALDADLQPTPFARSVSSFESWVTAKTGATNFLLPMLKTAPAWSLFKSGVINSIILIAGALVATFLFALVMGAAQGARNPILHWPARAVTVVLQSSPIVLTLVIAAAVAQALFPYSDAVAIGAAIVALGLTNGSNAGQAISEAMSTLRAEHERMGLGAGELFRHSLGRSASQLVSFLVNAAKGTPIASFIGAPELLSSLTDITSFSAGRVTTYWLLLIFYIVVVMIVVWLCNRLQAWLARSLA